MKMHVAPLLTILCLALSAPAFGDLYSNGQTNGTQFAYFLNGYAVSDSFVPSHPTDCAEQCSFEVALWVSTGSTPSTLDWAIGTSPFGSDVASGSGGGVGYVLLCQNGQLFYHHQPCGGGFGYDVYYARMGFIGAGLTSATTYWLTLTGATDSFGGTDGWDVNSGPSLAFHSLLGAVPSESFTVSECPECSIPEPSSILLFGSGIILGLSGVLRRKLL
jgi:hypothetical protein